MQVTYHPIHPFKAYNSQPFSMFNNHFNLILEYSNHIKNKPYTHQLSLPIPSNFLTKA